MTGPREDQPVVLPEFPTRPSDLPELATVDELVEAYHHHLLIVVGGRDRPADEFTTRHALAALAIGQAIVDTFLGERWHLVHDGLIGGATVDELGGALGGLEVVEIATGLVSWASRQHEAGLLSLEEYAAVVALISGGAR